MKWYTLVRKEGDTWFVVAPNRSTESWAKTYLYSTKADAFAASQMWSAWNVLEIELEEDEYQVLLCE